MKQEIQWSDYAGQICKELPKGALLTTQWGGTVNTMTIGWGTLGYEWSKPVFVVYVRESRYTRELLDQSGEFTVNIPYGPTDRKILGFCGTKSGRDVNKIESLGLTLEAPVQVAAPGIRELPLTLECKVIYRQLQELPPLPEKIAADHYPADSQGKQDRHIAYYGEIVGAYLITE